MKGDVALCDACGATLAPGSSTCRLCGRTHAEPSPSAPKQAHAVASQPADPKPPAAPAGPFRATQRGAGGVTPFRPAPRVPAPLRAARPGASFRPVAGTVASENGFKRPPAAPEQQDGVLELKHVDDITPGWVYWSALIVSIIGFLWAFVFWASSSPLITTFWRAPFFALMVVFAFTAIFVSVRITKRERYHVRARQAAQRAAVKTAQGSRAFAVKRKEGMARFVHEARAGVTGAGRSLRSSGTHFREGFSSDKPPNFIVKTLLGFVRAGIWVYMRFYKLALAIWRLALFFLRIGLWFYRGIVRLGWRLYRGLVEPILLLTFRTLRWALGTAYRVVGGALRLSWKIFYWLVRRWPVKYATRLLEVPSRVHVAPVLLSTDIILSDALHVPVRPEVMAAAQPSAEAFRFRQRVRRAAALQPVYDERSAERADRLVIPRPEDRRAARRARAERRKTEKERQQQLKREEEETRKAAAERAKELAAQRKAAEKAAAEETKERLAAEKAAGRKLSKEERTALEEEIRRKHLPQDAAAPEAEAKEAAPEPPTDAKAQKAQEKARARAEKAREKEELQAARQERKRAREDEKRERKARKEAEKESKPLYKERLKALKKEGRKLDKEEKERLRQGIVDGLVEQKLGRAPSPARDDPPAAPEREPAGAAETTEPGDSEDEAPVAEEQTMKKGKRGFSLKRRREKEKPPADEPRGAPVDQHS